MARLFSTAYSSVSISQTVFAGLTLVFCAFTLFLCASHTRKWRRWGRRRSSEPVIQQLQYDGILFSPTQAWDDNNQQQQVSGPVWQKNILMGGKCQLPDFSGVIIYDSAGNVVPPNKPSQLALPWK